MNARQMAHDLGVGWSPALIVQTITLVCMILGGVWVGYQQLNSQIIGLREDVAGLKAAFNAHLAEPRRAEARSGCCNPGTVRVLVGHARREVPLSRRFSSQNQCPGGFPLPPRIALIPEPSV